MSSILHWHDERTDTEVCYYSDHVAAVRDERDRIRTELLSLASERAGVAGRNTALTGFMRRYLIDLASVLDVVGGSDPAAVPHPATQDGEAGR